MKQLEIEINGARYLFVEVAPDARVEMWYDSLLYSIDDGKTMHEIDIPRGNYSIIGFADDEDACKQVLPEQESYYGHYKNGEVVNYIFHTATESMASLLKANGVETVNKYGIEEPELEPICCGNWQSSLLDPNMPQCCCVAIPSEESVYLQELWQEAQSQIWQKILILKID